MTLTINRTTMTSDQTAHTARQASDRNGWEVSWLPGQIQDRNTGITAMTLAARDAIAKASQPPDGTIRQQEQASRQPDREAAD